MYKYLIKLVKGFINSESLVHTTLEHMFTIFCKYVFFLMSRNVYLLKIGIRIL